MADLCHLTKKTQNKSFVCLKFIQIAFLRISTLRIIKLFFNKGVFVKNSLKVFSQVEVAEWSKAVD